MTNTSDLHAHAPVVQKLKDLIISDPTLAEAITASLIIAVERASTELNPDLFLAIDHLFYFNGWPLTIESYFNYLDIYVRLVPDSESDPLYPYAWTSTDEKNGYNQKVYDLLCQFYWLVNQDISETGLTLQNNEKFAAWLVEFAQSWGSFLETPPSLTKESLNSFKYNPMYNFELYADNATSWNSFNEFFFRQFNQADPDTGISPLRPISDPSNNQNIVAPADCTYKQDYPIDAEGNVVEIKLKQTHTIGKVSDLLSDSQYKEVFYGGTFVHYFLGPFDYHRFHTPISGNVLEIKALQGKVYLNVEMGEGQFHAPDGSASGNGYEFNQARGLIIVDGGSEIGKIAILPIGMAQVSGVHMYTELQGKNVVKGQEFGKFSFGGSDIIMLFEKMESQYLFKKDPGHNPIHFQYGQTVGYLKK